MTNASHQRIRDNGVIGAGGAGFPSHLKLQAQVEHLVMNAAECEPLFHKDKEILQHHAGEVLDGLAVARRLSGAKRGVIGIKRKHAALISSLRGKLPAATEIVPLDDFYPAGDEVTLIYLTTGRVVQPGQLPASVGCLVLNVETLYNIGRDEPVTDKFITVGGAVSAPASLPVPVGTSFRQVLKGFQITTRDYALVADGLMMGAPVQAAAEVVSKRTGGIIVLPADHPYLASRQMYSRPAASDRMAKAACDQCSFCTELCPRYLLGHPVRPELAMRNRMFNTAHGGLNPGSAFCCECNLCTVFACPEGLDPRGCTLTEKRLCREQGLSWQGLPVSPHPMASYRQTPTAKLRRRLGLTSFEDTGPMSSAAPAPAEVCLPLNRYAGEPPRAVVKRGDRVRRGQAVARPQGTVSATVHASIDGVVSRVDETRITVRSN